MNIIEALENGKTIKTKAGELVTNIIVNKNDRFPITGVVNNPVYQKTLRLIGCKSRDSWDINGIYLSNKEPSELDLIAE